MRIAIYAHNGLESKRSISRTKEAITCVAFRPDGKLLALGDASGLVQVHELGSRSILRSYRCHIGPVRSLVFCPERLARFASAGDDRSIHVFELSSETPLVSIPDAHSDYIRSLAWVPGNSEALLSVAYDHHAKLWDVRPKPMSEDGATASALPLLLDVDIGLPIESVLFHSPYLALLAAGAHVYTLNILGTTGASAETLRIQTGHQKTITSLAHYGTYVLAVGLDGGLKALSLDPQTSVWTSFSAFSFSGPVLALAAMPGSSTRAGATIVAGLSNGLVIFKTTEKLRKESAAAATDSHGRGAMKERQAPLSLLSARPQEDGKGDGESFRPNSFRYFMRAGLSVSNAISVPASVSTVGRLKSYDRYLKKFQYAKALEAAASEDVTALLPLLLELIHRSGLKTALASPTQFSEALVHSVGSFVIKNLSSPSAFPVLERTVSLLLDALSFSALEHSPALSEFFVRLRSRIAAELAVQRDMASVLGTLQLVLNNSTLAQDHQ